MSLFVEFNMMTSSRNMSTFHGECFPENFVMVKENGM